MFKILSYIFPQKALPSFEEENVKALKGDYEKALHAYHDAVEKYHKTAYGANEDVLYHSMVIARENVNNAIRLIKLHMNAQ